MAYKKYTALLLALTLILLSFSGCAFFSGNETTTASPTDETQFTFAPETSSTQTAQEETTGTEETTEFDDFEFEPEEAEELGKINSEIYGRLTVYFQDDHIALLDDYGTPLFAFGAEGLSPLTDEHEDYEAVACDDMNFDGYADLRILYRTTSLNAYYLCWMWDMTEKAYVYYEPLSSIPTPSFEQNAHTVVSLNKSSRLSATLTTYNWQDGELYPIDHRIISTENETEPGSDDVDRTISITDGLLFSYVVLNCTGNSNSRWICKVENENIVNLIGDTYNETLLTHKFVFQGRSTGTTTVVFRYAISWASDYVAEKVVNITVNDDKTLTITEIK